MVRGKKNEIGIYVHIYIQHHTRRRVKMYIICIMYDINQIIHVVTYTIIYFSLKKYHAFRK